MKKEGIMGLKPRDEGLSFCHEKIEVSDIFLVTEDLLFFRVLEVGVAFPLPTVGLSKVRGSRLRPFFYTWDDEVGRSAEQAIDFLREQLKPQ